MSETFNSTGDQRVINNVMRHAYRRAKRHAVGVSV